MKPKTLSAAIDAYLSELERRGCSGAHLRTVRSRLGQYARGRAGLSLIAAQNDLSDFFAEMRERGLASGTLAGHKSTHLAFWRWAADRRYCSLDGSNVLRGRDNRYSFRPVHSRAADPADFAAVVSSLGAFAAHRGYQPRDLRDAALVSLIADSACRRGEAWNLRRAAVVAALDRPKTVGHRHVHRADSQGKTDRVEIRFFDETAELLRRWLTHVPPRLGYVFLSLQTGKRIRIDALQIGLYRVCEFAGVRPFGFHAIRKRLVTDAIAASGDPKVGQLLAGHTSERTTLAYYDDIAQTEVDATVALLADRYRGGDGLARAFFGR